MPQVIVVPETTEYKLDVSHDNVIWITKKLGKPKLEERNVKYVAPLWVGEGNGVTRIYYILDVDYDDPNATEIKLGNSFRLEKPWNSQGQSRKFEYHDLSEFGLKEEGEGLLVPTSK